MSLCYCFIVHHLKYCEELAHMYKGIYLLIGSELSFFTRKLEAQLRFQDIPWKYHFKTEKRTAELEARAGTHFIPLLNTPENWIIPTLRITSTN